MKDLAPILLFTYKRAKPLKETIKALQNNVLASDSELFIFSDGAKTDDDREQVKEVRSFLKSVSGFKNITIKEAKTNKGLANSIIEGVTNIIQHYGKAIVLEDDLITSSNFLLFMNQCLESFEENQKVFSISGYTPPTISHKNHSKDIFFFPRNSSHGWATWKDRWLNIDWDISDFQKFISQGNKVKSFNYGGSDLTSMLKRQMEGKINSWSIRFCYHQYITSTLTVYPFKSKIQNIGFGADATHTNNYNRFYTKLDNGSKLSFTLQENVTIDETSAKEFQAFYSIKARAIGKLMTYLYQLGLLKNK